MVTLSIVMPAYNEAEHIERSVTEWLERVVHRIPGAELLVVDDCSTDGTGATLDAMASSMPGLRVIRAPQNMGHGPALRLAMERCTGDFVFQTDSDRQHTPDDFWALWREREHADFVFGVRDHRADGAFRAAISTVMRVANLVIWQRWITDANCPFKLMRRSALEPLLAMVPRDSFIPMVMLSLLARRSTTRVSEVEVRHFARSAGHQSLSGLLSWARIGRRCVAELFALRVSAQNLSAAPTVVTLSAQPSMPR
jgi:glycosyltransferase involved in cell wall biosynthesis